MATADDTELEDAVSAVKDARIIIMNPPFTNRAKMGEKFPKETQREDALPAPMPWNAPCCPQ